MDRDPRWRATIGLVTVCALVVSGSGMFWRSSPAGASLARGPDVRISEVANGGPGSGVDEFIEIANFGDETADLDGWGIYSCGTSAGRNGNPVVPLLAGVTLAPGETYLVAHPGSTVADIADGLFLSGFGLPDTGAGAYLADDQRRLVDAVAVYAKPTISDCGLVELPNDLDYKRGQSFQRVAITGEAGDFIAASRTPKAPNATEPDAGVQAGDVLVSELTNGGPAGDSDDFIELANFAQQPVDVGGWSVYRCSESGRRLTNYLQATLPSGTILEPGEVFVAAHTSVDLPDDVDNVRYATDLDELGFGALVEDADGNTVDAVGIYEIDGFDQRPTDSPCAQAKALPNRLDYGFNETYQRFRNTGNNAADFLRAPRTVGELPIHDPGDFPEDLSELPDADVERDPFEFAPVRVSELTHSGPVGHGDTFVELANYGDEPVSLDGWTIHHCANDGRRQIEPMVPSIAGATLAPGETFLAVREGSPLHQQGHYDAVYTVDLSGQSQGSGLIKDVSFGLIVYDSGGKAVDSVGVNTSGTSAVTPYNACAKGIFLSNLADTEFGESYQRLQATGTDAFDFIPARRSPGEVPDDLRHPTAFTDEELEPVDVAPSARPLPPAIVAPARGAQGVGADVELRVSADHTTGQELDATFWGAEQIPVVEAAVGAFTGVSSQAPPAKRRPSNETRVARHRMPLDGTTPPLVVKATEAFPHQRYELVVREDLGVDEIDIVWNGRSVGRNELQLYAWNHVDGAWELLDVGGGLHGGEITLIGRAPVDSTVRGRRVDVLVQDGPGTRAPFSDEESEPNLAFKDTDEYDFSFGFMSDTQWIAEGFRRVFAEMNRWLVTNQDARRIAYSFHTGDLIEKWTRQVDVESRGREQFQFASDVMSILEDGGHPHGVIPGNHDNITGRSNDLFNEYFPPGRYEAREWWGDSWKSDDNLNHFDVVEVGGAKFLMMYLGYFGGPCSWPQATQEARAWCADKSPDDTIAWANQVIAAHPHHNVVVATHNYITSNGVLASPDTSRWNEVGYRYWEEVILPNENVFLVLSGHNQGVALNIKRDVGGVEGRIVVEMLADYAGHNRAGRRDVGFLRLLQVDVDAKTMAVNSYSPWLDEHNAWEYDRFEPSRYDDADDEFTLEIDINDIYDKRVETDLIGLSVPAGDLGTTHVGAGEDATLIWNDLKPGTTHAWYVEVRDAGGASAISQVGIFTTGP